MLSMRTNLMSNTAIRFLNLNYDRYARSVARLASGKRITTAQDDPAGMAVVSKLNERITVLRQGARNADQSLSMLQTIEGTMQSGSEILVRMNQLAEQAATGSYSGHQRSIINAEFKQLVEELNRMGEAAEFNGLGILDGSTRLDVHFGEGDRIQIHPIDARADALGLGGIDLSNPENAQQALGQLQAASDTHHQLRAGVGANMNRIESAKEVLSIEAENLMAARARIEDVDVAQEVSEMVKHQVLTQASVAMTAQANESQKMILKLLE